MSHLVTKLIPWFEVNTPSNSRLSTLISVIQTWLPVTDIFLVSVPIGNSAFLNRLRQTIPTSAKIIPGLKVESVLGSGTTARLTCSECWGTVASQLNQYRVVCNSSEAFLDLNQVFDSYFSGRLTPNLTSLTTILASKFTTKTNTPRYYINLPLAGATQTQLIRDVSLLTCLKNGLSNNLCVLDRFFSSPANQTYQQQIDIENKLHQVITTTIPFFYPVPGSSWDYRGLVQNLAQGSSPQTSVIYTGEGQWIEAATEIVRIASSLNSPPVASDIVVSTKQDQSVDIQLLISDSNSEDTLTSKIVTVPTNGTIIQGSDPFTYRYNPIPGYYGNDSFQYQVNDGTVDSEIATVRITIQEVLPVLSEWPKTNNQIDLPDANEQFITPNKWDLPPRYAWQASMRQTMQMKLAYNIPTSDPTQNFDRTVANFKTANPGSPFGTYLSGACVIKGQSIEAYPKERLCVEDLGEEFTAGPAPWGKAAPYPQYWVDFNNPAALTKFAQLWETEIKERKARHSYVEQQHALMDNIAHPSSGFKIYRPSVTNPNHDVITDWIQDVNIPWENTLGFINDVKVRLQRLRLKLIVNVGWNVCLAPSSKIQSDWQALMNIIDGMSLEMAFHPTYRNKVDNIRECLRLYKNWLDNKKYLGLYAVLNLHPVQGSLFEEEFNASMLMMIWEPDKHSGYAMRNIIPARRGLWWNLPSIVGQPLGAYDVISASPLILQRRFSNVTITVNVTDTLWTSAENPNDPTILNRLQNSVTWQPV